MTRLIDTLASGIDLLCELHRDLGPLEFWASFAIALAIAFAPFWLGPILWAVLG
jgi:hypothetical protein